MAEMLELIHLDPATVLIAIFALGGLWRQFKATEKWTRDHEKWHQGYIAKHDEQDAKRDETLHTAVRIAERLEERSEQHEKRIDRLEDRRGA